MASEQSADRPNLRRLSTQIDELTDQLGQLDATFTDRVAAIDAVLVPMQQDVATLNMAVRSLVGLDGVAQEVARLADVMDSAVGVLGPPAPPQPGVGAAIQAIKDAVGPDYYLRDLPVANDPPPYIGEPRLFVGDGTRKEVQP